jgi:hypothetical protein
VIGEYEVNKEFREMANRCVDGVRWSRAVISIGFVMIG